jgi:protein pelota
LRNGKEVSRVLATEVLLDPAVAVLLGDTKAAAETKALQEFYLLLRDAPDRAVYGYKDVVIANDLAAIDQLLITDALFRLSYAYICSLLAHFFVLYRSRDTVQRQKYIDLVDSARTNGATVRIFSSLHVSGEHLGQLTGVAAILRFPVHIPDDDDDSDEDCGDSDRPVAAAATAAGLDSDTDSDSEVFVSSASVSRSVSADPSVGKNSDNDS